jgi:hypothetical protein
LGKRKESGRFLEKAAQKLLLCWVMGGGGDDARGPKGRKTTFCSQKVAFPSLACRAQKNGVWCQKIKPDFCRVALKRPPFLLEFLRP